MKQVYFYDKDTNEFAGYDIIDDTAEIPAYATTVAPTGLYAPTWNKNKNSWDSLTKEEWDKKHPVPAPKPTPEQIQLAALTKQVMALQAAAAQGEAADPKETSEVNEAMYEMFKAYYPLGLFTVDDCRLAVQVHYFGKKEFKEITGQDYDAQTDTVA